jgi:hypothetical protein
MFHSRPARKVRAYRPRLEVLESRTLLSTYLVDHLADDGVGTGTSGSLRYAITHAVDGDAINFGVTGTINLTGALPGLAHNIGINGPGANLLTVRRDTGGDYSIFTVSAAVAISGLTIANGYSDGGGIYNDGSLTLSNCTVTQNQSLPYGHGGGILNDGVLTVSNCTVTQNYAYSYGHGGGILNHGTATVNNSTITNNAGAYVGGVANEGGAMTTVSDSTITANSALFYGGGISGPVTLHNTIIAGNSAFFGPDVYGQVNSQGYNLIGNNEEGSGFVASDLVGTRVAPINPLLGPLQNNGGPTQTIALLAGSPALNTGDPAQLGVADQRGVVRRGGVNIGAYQASASAFVLTAPARVTGGTPFSITVQAVDPFQQPAVGYTGTVHFTASNGAMADYAFTTADGGQHTFSGLVLRRAQALTVTGSDTSNDSITGSTTFTITPAAADHLMFLQQPTDTAAGQTIIPAVVVAVVDAFGNVETGDNSDTVTLSLGVNPSGGTLRGTLTVTVSGGIATFRDLSIDRAGAGYTLHATVGGGLPDSDSEAFTITL